MQLFRRTYHNSTWIEIDEQRSMAALDSVKIYPPVISRRMEKTSRPYNGYNKMQAKCRVVLPSGEAPSTRRHVLVWGAASFSTILTLNYGLVPSMVRAEDKSNGQEGEDDDGAGVIGAIKSLFDPNEKTKSGKVLPKAYLNSAREVVKTLRESLNEDPKDNAKFRRTADAAKESIREYLSNWRGQQTVVQEESYVVLEKAIRSLAGFYSKAGPSAALPEEIKSEILNDLNTAEESL